MSNESEVKNITLARFLLKSNGKRRKVSEPTGRIKGGTYGAKDGSTYIANQQWPKTSIIVTLTLSVEGDRRLVDHHTLRNRKVQEGSYG
jgi:hypothetical protein